MSSSEAIQKLPTSAVYNISLPNCKKQTLAKLPNMIPYNGLTYKKNMIFKVIIYYDMEKEL